MPEAITKYAINNSLGTGNFKPLNKQIDDYWDILESRRNLCASDIVLKVINSTPIYPYIPTISEAIPLGSFIPKMSGTVRIKGIFKPLNSSSDNTFKLFVQKDSITVAEIDVSDYQYESLESSTLIDFKTISLDLNVEANATYQIFYSSKAQRSQNINLSVCGLITDNTAID